MRVIAKKILREFWENHSDCEQQLKAWYSEAIKGRWNNCNEIKQDYPSASILADNCICFNINRKFMADFSFFRSLSRQSILLIFLYLTGVLLLWSIYFYDQVNDTYLYLALFIDVIIINRLLYKIVENKKIIKFLLFFTEMFLILFLFFIFFKIDFFLRNKMLLVIPSFILNFYFYLAKKKGV